MSKAKLILAVLLAVVSPSCGDAPVTAPADSTLLLTANPPFIVANGGVSVVTAVITEPNGTFVPNGTEVFFFTTLGTIEERRETKDGVARVNLVADARSGTASITAVSGGVTSADAVTVVIGSSRPSRAVVTASPPAMRSNASSQITANVFDEFGNPVANVPVIFSVTSGDATGGVSEYLESGGSQRFTDSNGQAFDTLRSRRPLSEAAVVTVTGTAPNGIVGSTTVAIN